MPVGTRRNEPIKHELHTLQDGYVVLRQLSYDEMLERRDGATKLLMERGPTGRSADSKMAVQIANRWSNQYSFPRCIVEHNITDENGVSLDFSERSIDMTFRILDPRIGAEIERLIDEMNNEEEVDEDFPSAQNGSSQGENVKPSLSSVET